MTRYRGIVLILSILFFFPVFVSSKTVTSLDVSSLANRFINWKNGPVNNSLRKSVPLSISSLEMFVGTEGKELGHIVHLLPNGFFVLSPIQKCLLSLPTHSNKIGMLIQAMF